MKVWTYTARLGRRGKPVVEFVEVEEEDLPPGTASYATWSLAKAGYRYRQKTAAPRATNKWGVE